MDSKTRKRIIREIWRSKHRDFRSTSGDCTHPSVLAYDQKTGGVSLVPLNICGDADLLDLHKRFVRPRPAVPVTE